MYSHEYDHVSFINQSIFLFKDYLLLTLERKLFLSEETSVNKINNDSANLDFIFYMIQKGKKKKTHSKQTISDRV